MKLIDLKLDEYLDILISDEPAPGGGSVSALACAQGAALISMVCDLTTAKKKYADDHGTLTGGTFGARDILIDIMYARQLGPMFKVGVTLKPVYSIYESYSSFALGVDIDASDAVHASRYCQHGESTQFVSGAWTAPHGLDQS